MKQARFSPSFRGFLTLVAVALANPSLAAPPFPPKVAVARVPKDSAAKLPPSVTAKPLADGRWEVTFSFKSDRPVAKASVAGDFNGWNRDALVMVKGADGTWRARTEVGPGMHQYKFVLDGDRWTQDPGNPDGADDNHGGKNSVLRLGALANLEGGGGKAGDGEMNAVAFGHEPEKPIFRQKLSDGAWLLRFRTLAGDVETVEVHVEGTEPVTLSPALSDGVFAWWEATVVPQDADARYVFVVRDGKEALREAAIHRLDPKLVAFETPDWAKEATWYQIMADRFRNGKAANDPDRTRPWTSEWFTPSDWEGKDGQSFWKWYVFDRMYGGDLAGIRERIPYLKELGVTAIYLNPVFEADSHHRYNARTFVHIDDNLGTKGDFAAADAKEDAGDPKTWTWTASDREFLDLVAELKRNGIRVILDGVFNHVGDRHTAFLDVKEKGARSKFREWFAVRSFEPFEYDGWAGFGALPVFAKTADGFRSDEVKEHVFAVTRRWMDPNGDGDPSDGIDGWRLDVPNEVPMGFWREWRKVVKGINPDAYITGEIWRRADAWLDGATFDAVMNYPFADAAIAWVGNRERKIAASELDRRLAELRLAYPAEVTAVLQNLLDSHDTDRIASMLANPDRNYDEGNRPQDGATGYDGSKPGPEIWRKVRLLALLQATYVGAPMIWNGAEAGMWGADDPTNRKPLLWEDLEPYVSPEDRVDREMLAWYRKVFSMRAAHAALRTGSFRTLLVDDAQDVWVFERSNASERIVVALNAGSRDATVTLPGATAGARDLLGGSDLAKLPTLVVPATGGVVIAFPAAETKR
jgi:glycosidase